MEIVGVFLCCIRSVRGYFSSGWKYVLDSEKKFSIENRNVRVV